MKKLWSLAFANLKKTKSVSVTLVALFLLAALLTNIGLLIIVNYGSYFDDIKEELHSSDAYYYVPESLYNSNVLNYMNEDEHVTQIQKNDSLVIRADLEYMDKIKTFSIVCFNMEEDRELSQYKYVGEHEASKAGELDVYVPDLFKSVGGYKLGDPITLKYFDEEDKTNKEVELVIKGFIEDVFFSSTDTGFLGFYVPEETYNKLAKDYNCSLKANIIYANLDNVNNSSKVETNLRNKLNVDALSLMGGDSSKLIFSIDSSLIEMSRCMMSTMIAVMMVLFAFIIVVVCLLVVRFRIINSLEDDILKIGSLKSIGYTDSQIRVSMILQFAFIAFIGAGIGIVLSYLCIPPVSNIFERQSGLSWSQQFDPMISIPVLLILLLIVIAIVYLVSRKIKKITPVIALRGELKQDKRIKNHMPLDKSNGGLTVILALKSVLQNMKQNIMITIILVAVTFAGIYGVIMFYNTSIDTNAFEEIPGMEVCNAIVALNNEKDMTPAINKVEQFDEVEFAQFIDQVKVNVDGTEAECTLMESYDKKKTRLVYEGTYPKNQGEIVLAGILAERLNKKVGDTVTIQVKGNMSTLKVTGLSNGSAMGGVNCTMLLSDYKTLSPDYKQQLLNIYLKKGTNAKDFLEKVREVLDEDDYLSFTNFDKEMEEGMESYQAIVAAMGITMFVVTILIILLVLYFVISSSIIRKRREIGIKKAIGFSTLQLMNEYSISFLIPVTIGTILGSILGITCCNPMMSLAMKGVGIMRAGFIISPIWCILFGCIILVLSYVISLLITWRIRKISAYALVTE